MAQQMSFGATCKQKVCKLCWRDCFAAKKGLAALIYLRAHVLRSWRGKLQQREELVKSYVDQTLRVEMKKNSDCFEPNTYKAIREYDKDFYMEMLMRSTTCITQ